MQFHDYDVNQRPLHRLIDEVRITKYTYKKFESLLAGGMSVNVLDALGQTPLDLAKAQDHSILINFLRDKGALTSDEMVSVVEKAVRGVIAEIRQSRKHRLKAWHCMREYLDMLRRYVRYHPKSWRPLFKRVDDQLKYCFASNLGGNFFTSNQYPWPETDGVPMAPVVQLDLKVLRRKFKQSGQIGTFPYSDGLLQVWTNTFSQLNSSPGMVRVIPKIALQREQLTRACPDIDLMDYPDVFSICYETLAQTFLITGFEQCPSRFVPYYQDMDDFEGFSQPLSSEAEGDAIMVEAQDNRVGDLTELLSITSGDYVFGVSNYDHLGDSELERHQQGWQHLISVSNSAKLVVEWREDQLQMLWTSLR